LAASGAARARFAREARAAAAVLHENVVAIHRVAEAKSLPYLVMPYVPGDSLQKRLDEQGPLQVTEILRIGMQIAAGLAAAHAQGLVHRDIKPGNILLDKGVERVTITDFGLARAADDASLTRSGVIAGTPQYMSPEQARGEPLDGRSDLFSLGSVLYALCVGWPPFRAETAFGVLQRIGEAAPTPIREIATEVPEWLCEIIAKLHAKRPEDRFASAGEVSELLGRWLAHVQQPTVIPVPKRTGGRRQRGNKGRQVAMIGTFGLAAIGVTAAVVLLAPSWNGNEGEQKTAHARAASDTAQHQVDYSAEHGDGEDNVPREQIPREGIDKGSQDARWAQSYRAVSQSIVDEQTLRAECQNVRAKIAEMESRWSQPAAADNDAGWRVTVQEIRQQLEDLSRRIESN
jgi:serine/threonine protein kinase